MKIRFYFFILSLLLTIASCSSGSSDKSTENTQDSTSVSGDGMEEVFSFTHNYVMAYALDAVYDNSIYVLDTIEGDHRFVLIRKFHSNEKGDCNFVYRAFLKKEPWGWELDDLIIDKEEGEQVFAWSEATSNEIKAGGITFKKIEGSGDIIRLSTPKKLTRRQLRNAIMELKNTYGVIQFATEAHPERGQEYAAWAADIFFDFDKNETIDNGKFLK